MLSTLLRRLRRAKKNYYIKGLVKKGLKIGRNTQIVDECFFDAGHCFLVEIKDNCTIAPKVSFIAHDASTYKYLGYSRIGKITIHDNCFIGLGAIILPSVSIGPNSIVAAGSVVTKDVPENSVVAGNPAKVLLSTSDYLERIQSQFEAQGEKVFGEEYHHTRITPERLEEMLQAVENGRAFIR